MFKNKVDKIREISRSDLGAAKEYRKHSRSRGIPLRRDAILLKLEVYPP